MPIPGFLSTSHSSPGPGRQYYPTIVYPRAELRRVVEECVALMALPEKLPSFVDERKKYVKESEAQGSQLREWHGSWRDPFLNSFRPRGPRYEPGTPGAARAMAYVEYPPAKLTIAHYTSVSPSKSTKWVTLVRTLLPILTLNGEEFASAIVN